jgi:hypothetical protein
MFTIRPGVGAKTFARFLKEASFLLKKKESK